MNIGKDFYSQKGWDVQFVKQARMLDHGSYDRFKGTVSQEDIFYLCEGEQILLEKMKCKVLERFYVLF
jgi:hypothetical protein